MTIKVTQNINTKITFFCKCLGLSKKSKFQKTATNARNHYAFAYKKILFTAGKCKLWTLSGIQFDPELRHKLRKWDKLTYIFY